MNNKKINFGKKGISAIVATVLIILITVAAVTIVWVAIIPMIGDQLESGTACLNANTNLQIINEGFNCVGEDGANVTFQIQHGSTSFGLIDVQILVSASGSTSTFRLLNDTSTLDPADIVLDNLPQSSGAKRVFTIDTSGMTDKENINGIQIAPVISIGNSEKTCDPSVMMALPAC